MSTVAQKSANQANAENSTGPKTETGKAASSVNHRKHALTGCFFVLPDEDEAEFRRLFNDLEAEHKPSTRTEEILVEKMAQHYWVSQRAHNMQDFCLFPENNGNPGIFSSLSLFMRYQTTHDRAFHKCLDQLLKLRAEKRKERLDEAALSRRAEESKIGFESQKLKQAAQEVNEIRKQEAHQAKVRVQNAKAEWQELNTEIKGRIEAVLPGHTAVKFEDMKPYLKTAIQDCMAFQASVAA